MWDRHPVRLALLHMLPDVAEQRGVALTPLMARAGLAAEAGFTDGIIASRAQVCTLLLHLGKRAGEPTIGIALADAADPIRLGLSGRALFTGLTLRDCLVGHARQMPGLQGASGSAWRSAMASPAGTTAWRTARQSMRRPSMRASRASW